MRWIIERFRGPIASYVGGIALLTGAVSTYWDIATHIDIGRDRFLTPAHIGIYSSVLITSIALALSGLADHLVAGDSIFDAIRHPFRNLRPGIGVAGAGMVTVLVAAPLDNGWHEVYGIDVTIWSPPHLLAIFGIGAAALGLAALLAPASTRVTHAFYPVVLSGFLTTLLITIGEFDFNAPQYRIAYHPVVLSAVAALVFTAASGERWRATKVALWFEVVRIAAVLFLLLLGRSLAFVPVLLPAAVIADLIPRDKLRGLATGLAVTVTVVLVNWLTLELLPGLRWPIDDLALGAPLALAAGAVSGRLGWLLGARLDGVALTHQVRGTPRIAPAALLTIVLLLATTPALAHEVGGARGKGVIRWMPQVPEAGQPVEIRVDEVTLRSGTTPSKVRVEAWRAEHRIKVPVAYDGSVGTAELTFPEQGSWYLFVRAEADGEALLWGGRFIVGDDGQGVPGTHRQDFTLGVDTLAGDGPPAWVDWIGYVIALAVLVVLIRGVLRALARLPIQTSEGAG